MNRLLFGDPKRRALGLVILAILLVIFGGAVYAQTTAPTAVTLNLDNFKAAASNPLVFIGIIISLVADLRGVFKVSGKIGVIILAAGTGLVLGIIYQFTGFLAVSPFTAMIVPWGGAAYGVLGGIGAYLGVNLYDLLSLRHATNVATQAAAVVSNTAATPASGGGAGNASSSSSPSSPPSG